MKPCLVVDDSRVIRKVARRILEGLGFAVTEAADGAAALAACRAAWPALVLLDWEMPVMDGLTFLTEMRRLPGGDRPMVVFCTTLNTAEHIQKAFEAGANEYIMKPFDHEILRGKLMQIGLYDEDP